MRSKFTKIRVLAIIAGLFLAILPSKAQSVRFIDALRNYQQGNFGEAKALFLEELAENPSNDAAAYYLATIFSANEAEMEEAEEYLKMALRLAPDNFWYKYVLAQFYSSTRRPELAAPLLEELISDNPKKSEIYIDLAGLYLSENDVDKALATLDKIDAIKGKSETVALTKTDLLMKRPGGAALKKVPKTDDEDIPSESEEDEEDEGSSKSSRDKANFILRKLEAYGWIYIDVDHSYVQRVNFRDYAIPIMKTLLAVSEEHLKLQKKDDLVLF